MNVAVIGANLEVGNRGVRALARSVIEGVLEAEPSARVTLIDYGREGTCAGQVAGGEQRRRLNHIHLRFSRNIFLRNNVVRLLAEAWLRRVWCRRHTGNMQGGGSGLKRALADFDAAVAISGGDSFSDIYGMRQMLYVTLPVLIVHALGCRVALLPQTFGPYRGRAARWLARRVLNRAAVIIARDGESQRVAHELVDGNREVWSSPDVAFALRARTPECIVLDPPPSLSPKPEPSLRVIGLNPNGLMYNGGYTRRDMFRLKLNYEIVVPEVMKLLLREHPGELWLVPHTYGPPDNVESDPEACRRVRAALPEQLRSRVRIVTGEYDCHEIKGVIGQCGFFIGSRMHACIAALSQGIPCVGIAYSMKFAGVFETVGMQDWVIDGRTATNEEALHRVLELYRRRDSVREALRQRAEEARARLKEVFRHLFATIGAGDEVAAPDERHVAPAARP